MHPAAFEKRSEKLTSHTTFCASKALERFAEPLRHCEPIIKRKNINQGMAFVTKRKPNCLCNSKRHHQILAGNGKAGERFETAKAGAKTDDTFANPVNEMQLSKLSVISSESVKNVLMPL